MAPPSFVKFVVAGVAFVGAVLLVISLQRHSGEHPAFSMFFGQQASYQTKVERTLSGLTDVVTILTKQVATTDDDDDKHNNNNNNNNVPAVEAHLQGANNLARSIHNLNTLLAELNTLNEQLEAPPPPPTPRLKAGGKPTLASGPTTTTTTMIPFDYRQISSMHSDLCLDSGTYSTKDGVKLYGCNKGLPQGFWIGVKGEIRHSSGLCLNAAKENTIEFITCDTTMPSQIFEILKPTYSLTYGTPLRNKASQLCMDNTGRVLQQKPCTRTCTQMWLPTNIQNRTDVLPAIKSIDGHLVAPRPNTPEGLRILCWAVIDSGLLATAAVAINNTWGQQCDTLVFFSTDIHAGLNIELLSGDDTQPVWDRNREAWTILHATYRKKAEWFFKADDDTYVVLPYLREFVDTLDPTKLAYYGRRMHYAGLDGPDNIYVSGGSGLLVNRETLDKLCTAPSNVWHGSSTTGPADLLVSRILNQIGASAEDTRDDKKSHRFIALGLETEYAASRESYPDLWLWKYSPDAKELSECCSKQWIAAHYIKPAQMYSIHKQELIGCSVSENIYPFLAVPSREL